mmetsp:Transcript_26730/g.67738  ORF Transcript_26730/g.67738 Transcript_26730/m.67738 type:complete len:288 (+) Transcript_26730:1889-2752(+)
MVLRAAAMRARRLVCDSCEAISMARRSTVALGASPSSRERTITSRTSSWYSGGEASIRTSSRSFQPSRCSTRSAACNCRRARRSDGSTARSAGLIGLVAGSLPSLPAEAAAPSLALSSSISPSTSLCTSDWKFSHSLSSLRTATAVRRSTSRPSFRSGSAGKSARASSKKQAIPLSTEKRVSHDRSILGSAANTSPSSRASPSNSAFSSGPLRAGVRELSLFTGGPPVICRRDDLTNARGELARCPRNAVTSSVETATSSSPRRGALLPPIIGQARTRVPLGSIQHG